METNTDQRPFTYGEKAVGLSFNPSQQSNVDRIKILSANLIDEIESLRKSTESGEVKRMCSIAITEVQNGQMWGVKAATWKD